MSSAFLVSRRLTSLRFVQKRFSSLLSSPKQEELRIPVPWGHIAGTPNHMCTHIWVKSSAELRAVKATQCDILTTYII